MQPGAKIHLIYLAATQMPIRYQRTVKDSLQVVVQQNALKIALSPMPTFMSAFNRASVLLRPVLLLQGKNIEQEDVETALETAQSEATVLLERQRSHSAAYTSAKRDMPSITADPAAFHNISRSGTRPFSEAPSTTTP